MKTVCTVGHSNYDLPDFIALLRNSEIGRLVDIRSVPYSRMYPQFNKETLMRALETEGIQYAFLGDELGGRIKDLSCYKDRTIPNAKSGYARFLDYEAIRDKDWFNSGIAKLIEIADAGPCAIMCSEENPGQCHRELIVGRRLRELGYNITHIRSVVVRSGQLSLFG